MNIRLMICILIIGTMTACEQWTIWENFGQTQSKIESKIVGLDADLYNTFLELTNMPNCQLPCWWGFHLGETTLDDVYALLSTTDLNRSQARTIYADAPEQAYVGVGIYSLVFTYRPVDIDDIGDIRFYFEFDDNNILAYINVVMGNPTIWLSPDNNPLLLSNVLKQIASQPEILLNSDQVKNYRD